MDRADTPNAPDVSARDSVDLIPNKGPGRALDETSTRYLAGTQEPATSSVLISNSKYLNNPYYRDVFAQFALRRYGHDVPAPYLVPQMYRAVDDVTDFAGVAQLIVEEKAKNQAFAAWLDARRPPRRYRAADMGHYADGTLGAKIRAFIEKSGMDLDFIKSTESPSDLQYIFQSRTAVHDIEHMVTGFGPTGLGEAALHMVILASNSRYFSPRLAQHITETISFVASAGLMRNALHYPEVMPAYYDALQQGIKAGLALKRPLFMERWEDYLDWQLDDIAAHLGFQRGPDAEWEWSTEAMKG